MTDTGLHVVTAREALGCVLGGWGPASVTMAMNLEKRAREHHPVISALGAGWGDTNRPAATGCPAVQFGPDTDPQQLV